MGLKNLTVPRVGTQQVPVWLVLLLSPSPKLCDYIEAVVRTAYCTLYSCPGKPNQSQGF